MDRRPSDELEVDEDVDGLGQKTLKDWGESPPKD